MMRVDVFETLKDLENETINTTKVSIPCQKFNVHEGIVLFSIFV